MTVDSISREQYIMQLEAEVNKLREENHILIEDRQDLQSIKEVFSKVFDDHPLPIAISTLEGGYYEAVNQSYAQALGFTREEMLGKNSLELGIWIDLEQADDIGRKLVEGSISSCFESRNKNKDGESGTAITFFNIVEIDGQRYVVTSVTDITAEKQTEQSLQQSNNLFMKAFHNTLTMMSISTTEEGVFYDVNESFANNLGYKREEIIGKSVLDLDFWMDPEERQEMLEELSQFGYVKGKEYRFKSKTGEMGYVLSNLSLLNVDDQSCMLVSSHNITELKQYQNEISRLDKMSIIGQMAASIAHEIRNPMTSIKGFLQLFLDQDRYREDQEAMRLMIGELDRVNEIITTFLTLANMNILDLKWQSLNDVIEEMLPLITANAIKNDIEVQLELDIVPDILIDEGEIKQMLLNLAQNAIQAMPVSGKLTIKTFTNSEGINLVVSDEGTGIPQEIIEKIGTAFFTTKEEGTGLGVAVCYGIAERHNALITFDTSTTGTSFKVTFPAGVF